MDIILENQKQKLIEKSGLTPEYINTLLSVTKQRLGIMSAVRDNYIQARCVASLYSLFDERSIKINPDDTNHLLFLCDYTCWQYKNIDNLGDMPLNIRFRLNNLLTKNMGETNE